MGTTGRPHDPDAQRLQDPAPTGQTVGLTYLQVQLATRRECRQQAFAVCRSAYQSCGRDLLERAACGKDPSATSIAPREVAGVVERTDAADEHCSPISQQSVFPGAEEEAA